METEGQVARWNRLYDEAPPELRFPILVWTLVGVGTLNMLLTIWFGFPFGLLLVAAIATIAWVRVVPRLNLPRRPRMPAEAPRWSPAATYGEPPMLYGFASAFPGFNTWLDEMPEFQRLGVHLGILGIAGVVNMLLTINAGFPFGLLFLVALLAIACVRGPWVRARTRAAYLEARDSRQRPTALLPHSGEAADAAAPTPGEGRPA